MSVGISGLRIMAKKKHVHKYRRTTLGMKKWKIFRCIKPGCSHYIDAGLIIGKISVCPRCGDPFIIDKSLSLLALPHCHECTVKKKLPDRKITDFIEGLIQ